MLTRITEGLLPIECIVVYMVKTRTSILLPEGLATRAHAYGINVSAVAARSVADEIHRIAKQNKALEEITGGINV
jgi:post-segregation antitoxin (ccd killing protein)